MGAPKNPQREAALLLGQSTYMTGKPCKHGHIAPRNTVDCSCTGCRRVWVEAHLEVARVKAVEKRAAEKLADPEGYREHLNAYQRQRRADDPEKFRAWERKASKLKRQRYPKQKLADTRKRQADKLRRTPAWSDLKRIRQIYEDCPIGNHVDHVIPLRGKLVSGLHVPENLQYLPAKLNQLKGAQFHV